MEFIRNLLSGALSGLVVEIVLFPIDNLKTRAQSKDPFSINDFHKIYNGIVPSLIGSIPASAFFYCFYELSKSLLTKYNQNLNKGFIYIISTSIAEIISCTVRVPFEIIKQNMQANSSSSMESVISGLTNKENLLKFLIKSYVIMILREIPFDCIQYFLWESFKDITKKNFNHFNDKYPTGVSAICGGIAGGISGFLTTPLDIIKSRQMLYGKTYTETVKDIASEGYLSFYKGFHYRSSYLFFGGIVFFGSLKFFSLLLEKII